MKRRWRVLPRGPRLRRLAGQLALWFCGGALTQFPWWNYKEALLGLTDLQLPSVSL